MAEAMHELTLLVVGIKYCQGRNSTVLYQHDRSLPRFLHRHKTAPRSHQHEHSTEFERRILAPRTLVRAMCGTKLSILS